MIAGTAALFPDRARAFWPFSSDASAAASLSPLESRAPVLIAAINSDPNPDKGLTAGSIQTSDDALVAYSGPSGTMADVAGSTSSGSISVYVVRSGDTLSDIARMFDVSVNTIVWANNLGSSKAIHVGDTLVILPVSGIKRTVVKGDTLKSLAKKYGADEGEIADYNGLDAGSTLAVGSTIIIPGGEIAAPAPVKAGVVVKGSKGEPYLGGSGAAQVGYYANPLPGARVTQGIHGWNGVDLGGGGIRGTPIHAAADGTAIVAKNNGGWNGGYGNYVVITHSNGTQTLYSHMANSIVSPGQSVTSGQVIGYVGNTGASTGAHLHFEVRGAANPFRNCSVGSVCAPQ